MSTTRSRRCVASASSSPPGNVASRLGEERLRVTVIRNPSLSPRQRRDVGAAGVGQLLRRSGDALGVRPRAQLTVLFTDDAELRALNMQFLGVDAPTDVLAFPGDEDGDGRTSASRVGDIAISVERAQAQATDVVAELRLLAVHGLLHCLGHDHAGRDEAAVMTATTRELLPGQAVPEL